MTGLFSGLDRKFFRSRPEFIPDMGGHLADGQKKEALSERPVNFLPIDIKRHRLLRSEAHQYSRNPLLLIGVQRA